MRGWYLLCMLSVMCTMHAVTYRGAEPEHFIIRWAFQALCDHVHDPRKDSCHNLWPTSEHGVSFNPKLVKAGDLVFVRDCKGFFKSHHPKIDVPYFILTHGEFRDKFKPEYLKYLDDGKVLAWFTIHPIEQEDERVIPIPLGMLQYQDMYLNQQQTFDHFMELRAQKKEKMVYGVFTEWRMKFRKKIRQYFQDKPFYTWTPERMPFKEYIKELARHKFVLSPPGLGPDCYRVWESCMVGTIPIVQHSYLDYLYQGLPVLFVKDWSEVTQEFLDEQYERMSESVYSQKSLTMEYWIDRMNVIRKRYWPAQAGPFRPLLYSSCIISEE